MTYYFYKIKNKINNKYYIGVSINPTERYKKHLRELRNNVHHSIRLQNAWNKYKEESFEYEIIEEGEYSNFLDAVKREIELIAKYDSKENGYNMTDKISPMHNPEIARKVKKANQGKVDNVLQIDMETKEVVQIFLSLREAERETGIFRQNITKVCNRSGISAGGYYWSFEKDYDEFWIPKLNGKQIPIAILDKNGDFIKVYDSAAQASRELNLDRSNIRAAALRSGTAGGHRFKRISHEKYYEYFKTCRDYSLA